MFLTKHQMTKILNNPTIIHDIILEIHKACIEEAIKFDPEKLRLKGALLRIIALRLEYIAGNIKKRMEEIIKEYV